MNNPFCRLKHFTKGQDENDLQENHAAECLAACLVFSPRIRASFIEFLFGGAPPFKLHEESSAEVITQYGIEDGYIDLVLREEGVFVIALEIKVRSPENNSHHRDQLKRYGAWLSTETRQNGFLFTLVKNPDSAFDPLGFGVKRRICWLELYRHLQAMPRQSGLSGVEESLITNLCEYLEREAVVSTYEIRDLLSYSSGLRAQAAVTGILNQVSSRLSGDGFHDLEIVTRANSWPKLRISHPKWKNIFGKGKNQKVALWFKVPGIWDAEEHDFAFVIELFNEDHGNDWELIRGRLPKWFERLRGLNFEWYVWRTWTKCETNLTKIPFVPKYIDAWKKEEETFLTPALPEKENELVDTLVNRAKDYGRIVSSLKP